MDAFGLVAGEQIFMGPVDVRFDPATRFLDGTLISGGQSGGTVHLKLTGKHLNANVRLPNGMLYRLIEADKR